MPTITQEDLIAEAQHLYAYALHRIEDHHHAEDLVQETLIIAWNKRESFLGNSTLSTWLFGIMKFKILDHIRGIKRTPTQKTASIPPELSEERLSDPLDHLFNAAGAWRVDPNYHLEILSDPVGDAANREEVMEWVRRCLCKLPERLRLLFTLREVDELPVPEAAAAAGVTPGSAAVLLTRARHQMRACLQRHDITP